EVVRQAPREPRGGPRKGARRADRTTSAHGGIGQTVRVAQGPSQGPLGRLRRARAGRPGEAGEEALEEDSEVKIGRRTSKMGRQLRAAGPAHMLPRIVLGHARDYSKRDLFASKFTAPLLVRRRCKPHCRRRAPEPPPLPG